MRKLIVTILFLTFNIYLYSQMGGKYTYQFLEISGSSRIAALGGNNISHYDNDINFVFQNPALLRSEMNEKLMMNYISYVSDINLGQTIYVREIENIGTFAAGLEYFNYGKFLNANEFGNILGDFSASEYAIMISHSRNIIDPKFNVGASFKIIASDYWQYSSFGIALDAGVSYIDTTKLFSAGMLIKNLGTQIKPYTKGNYEPLPIDLQIGITKKFAHAPFRVSITAQHLLNWNLSYKTVFTKENLSFSDTPEKENFFDKVSNIGDEIFRHFILAVEIVPNDVFFISAGYNYQRRAEMKLPFNSKLTGFSIGAGFKFSKFSISYGLASYHLAGASNCFSLGLNLGAFYKKVND